VCGLDVSPRGSRTRFRMFVPSRYRVGLSESAMMLPRKEENSPGTLRTCTSVERALDARVREAIP
jgi:hypothetical protein